MTFKVYEADDAGWAAALERVPHDVYHTSGYARVCETHEPWSVRLAIADDGSDVVVLPFMLRELPFGESGCDVTVPYGYPGPVSSTRDISVQRALLESLFAGFAEIGAVSAFIRCHPFLGVDLSALEPFGENVIHGDQVYIDLLAVPESIESSFRPGHRQNIVTLKKSGFTLRVDDDRDVDAFPELYRRNMVRLDAEEYYHFPNEYFAAINAHLPESSHYVTAVSPEGDIAAIALVFNCGSIGQYHLSCTEDRFLKLAPSKLTILGMAELCRELGVEVLNLGGGVGGENDSLLKFKEGFSGCRTPFATSRVILQPERYADLSARVDAPAGFFPAYRRGL